MTDLLTRLEKLEGPCRKADLAIWRLSGEMPDKLEDIGGYFDPAAGNAGGEMYAAPKYTSSLDAIVGLIERDLPGWCRTVDTSHRFGYRVHLFDPKAADHGFACIAPKEAIALCIAYCRAKQAEGQT